MLSAFGPLLKAPSASPEATLVTTFMNWTQFLDQGRQGAAIDGIPRPEFM